MRDAEDVRAELAAPEPQLQEGYPTGDFGIFGSDARGEQRPESDPDVVVTFEQPVTLFDLVRLEEEVTRRLVATDANVVPSVWTNS